MTNSEQVAQNLEVKLHDKQIGNITYLGGDKSIFSFTQEYIEDENRPTLGLGFKSVDGTLITEFNSTKTKLLPFFSNLLPEGHLRQYISERLGINEVREYAMMAAIGSDLSGAVSIKPSQEDVDDEELPEAKNISSDEPIKFSLAGVQLKFSAIEESSGRLTIPAQGDGGSWIIKLPSMRFSGVAANEFSMMSLAKEIGIEVPEFKLISPESINGLPQGVQNLNEDAYAVRRFDRGNNGEKIHIEDFAQIFGLYPRDKYKKASYRNILQVLWLEDGFKSTEEFIKRVVFNTLIGNADMHLKNWSVIYKDEIKATLSPAYDFVSTIAYLDDENAALKYATSKKMTDLYYAEIAAMADKAGMPQNFAIKTARETVDKFKNVWQAESKNLPLTNELRLKIAEHAAKIPIYNV